MSNIKYDPKFSPKEELYFMYKDIYGSFKIQKGEFVRFHNKVDYEAIPYCTRTYFIRHLGEILEIAERNLFRTKEELLDSFK